VKRAHLAYLICPGCRSDALKAEAQREAAGRIETGTLVCPVCDARFPILRSIPRFVPMSNYADGFGLQWTKHARTQYDSVNGTTISRDRFFGQTGWPQDLRGETILEVGCGAGRFTEPAAATGAMVVSMDLSYSVDANYASHGDRENVLIIQADIHQMPFRETSFDRLFCFGVLQYTPDPARAFFTLPKYVKPGGRLAVDIYRRWGWFKQLTQTRVWIRPLTRRLPPARLSRLVEGYIHLMWPLARLLRSVPAIGRPLIWRLLVADHSYTYDLPEPLLREWAVLDTFNLLSPPFEHPRTRETVRSWFDEAGLGEVDVWEASALIIGRGKKPS